jgi:hypothetical protein
VFSTIWKDCDDHRTRYATLARDMSPLWVLGCHSWEALEVQHRVRKTLRFAMGSSHQQTAIVGGQHLVEVAGK